MGDTSRSEFYSASPCFRSGHLASALPLGTTIVDSMDSMDTDIHHGPTSLFGTTSGGRVPSS